MESKGAAFIDTETTGLDDRDHEIWEFGAIVDDVEFRLCVRPNLSRADPIGLQIGRYFERTDHLLPADVGQVHLLGADDQPGEDRWSDPGAAAEFIQALLDRRHLVGAVPDFDHRFLRRLLTRYDLAVSWHYHLIDVEALAIGFLCGNPDSDFELELPWESHQLTRQIGVDVSAAEEHTALGDARWAKAVFDRVMGLA